MIGNMVEFFQSKRTPLIHSPHVVFFSQEMNNWRESIRNGYFHKDIMKDDEVDTVRNSTLRIIFIILGLLPK